MSICTVTEAEARAMLSGEGGTPDFNTNYFVEAGAGAGKTYVLAHRIVKQLLAGACKPEELVAITFTVKATQETQERLDKLLLERWEEAKDRGDEAEVAHIQSIRNALGQMQVSTIHSFCQAMIQAMPFEANLGMDIHPVEDDTPYIDAFYRRKLRENPELFHTIRALSIDPYKLSDSFAELCRAGDSKLAYTPAKDSAMVATKRELIALCKVAHQELHGFFAEGKATYKNRKETMYPIFGTEDEKMLVPELAAFLKKPDPTDEELLQGMAQMAYQSLSPLRRYGHGVEELRKYLRADKKADVPGTYRDAHPLYNVMDTVKDYKGWKGSAKSSVIPYKEMLSPLYQVVHTTVMEVLVPLVAEYRREKAGEHRIDFNDILLSARNMLRDSKEARAYFHQRYRVLYVDEFQDTDYIQAQILFYLTTEEKDFHTDWEKCVPCGGSLFLVGDPKQAIYRFRGADIQIYTQVKTLFAGDDAKEIDGVGEVVTLQTNYRSDSVICEFVDKAFDPNSTTATAETLKESAYQAGYVSMNAHHGTTGRGEILHYMPQGKDAEDFHHNDPYFVADYIQKMVNDKTAVGTKGDGHPATYRDFLVLTYGKAAVQEYVAAMAQRGIPCNSSGDQKLQDALPIQVGLAHLETVANPTSATQLVRLLGEYYGVTLATMRRFTALAQGAILYTLFSQEARKAVSDQLTQSAQDSAVAELCAIGGELELLVQKARTLPPMAVIEWIFDGGFNLWQSNTPREKGEDYAMVQQFLNGVRQGAKGSLAEYCTFAKHYATKGIEYQLQLDRHSDCVRVMNLHKAKGLEGNVVILTYCGNSKPKPDAHVHREKNESTLYACIANKYTVPSVDKYNRKTLDYYTQLYGVPPSWETDGSGGTGWAKEESEFLTAEALRLNYVAATRAETRLVIAGGKEYHGALNTRWRNLYSQCVAPNATYTVLSTAPEVDDDDSLDDIDLTTADPVPATDAPMVSAPAPLPQLNTGEKEGALRKIATGSGRASRIAVSPSGLDHAAPRPPKKDDQDIDDQSADTAPQVALPLPQVAKDGEHAPYGSDWGTIVHRVMELSIREGCRDETDLVGYARQAITETLPNETLTATQGTLLFGKPGVSLTQGSMEWLSKRTAQALAFTADPSAPLNVALASGTPYPELSFFTAVEEGALYNHLSEHLKGALKKEPLNGRGLDVQGFIDLAVLTPEGWIVVDYKTDRIRTGEDEASYCARLKEEYTNQIAAYGLLLTQTTGQPTVGSYLCSIPLEGKLISLT